MPGEHHIMRSLPHLAIALSLALASGCTKHNPASCSEGACTDTALPFCDVDGTLEGLPNQCVAVACIPNAFAACRADSAITCNDTGTNYDLLACPLGCDDATGGCKQCEPNETACTNGNVVSCDAAGNVTTSVACPLGCFEDEPRCREVVPSNGLGVYADMVANPPDVDVTGYSFNTGDGTLSTSTGNVEVPSFLISTATPPVRVFVVHSLHLRGVGDAYSTLDPERLTGPAIAIVASGDVTIEGRFTIAGTAGGVPAVTCGAGRGFDRGTQADSTSLFSASGGGGNATRGGAGGGVMGTVDGPGPTPPAGGRAIGNDGIVPLMGGCASGQFQDLIATSSPPPPFGGGPGGGALQVTSKTDLSLDGVIDVRGFTGETMQTYDGSTTFGGGAGGSVLLEAPHLTLSGLAKLNAKGGAGGSTCGYPDIGTDDSTPQPAPTCGTMRYATGGAGAAPGVDAAAGHDAIWSQNAGTPLFTGGGGGGGLGRLRFNTRDGNYVKSSAALEVGVLTVGTLSTR